MKRSILNCLLILLSSISFVYADGFVETVEVVKFDSLQEEQRFRQLLKEIRCIRCQSSSVGDSDAPIAKSLRSKVFELMQQGKSNEQILAYLQDRYGDFVLYDPPFKPSTYLIWFVPLLFFLLAITALAIYLKKNQHKVASILTEEEQAKLNAIINDQEQK